MLSPTIKTMPNHIPNCVRANADALIKFHAQQGHTGTFLLSSEEPEAEGIPAKGTLIAVLSGSPAQLMAIQQFLKGVA